MINLRWNIAMPLLVTGWGLAAIVARRTAPEATAAGTPQAVTTYHYDNLRTGWNSNETVLTPSNVKAASFGILQQVTLDEQVDAQPLLVPGENITTGSHQGKQDVVYVATENNTIYAINASTGVVLFTRSLGPAVPMPLGCGNNSAVVGINGTPAIDSSSNSMYVIAYTAGDPNSTPPFSSSTPTYAIHELDLSNLQDRLKPTVVADTHPLDNGTSFAFNASVQRQRPGLLDANGNIYAGFGSFCDFKTNSSRGWVMGWQKGTLTKLANNKLTDTQTPPHTTPACQIVTTTPPTSCYYLSSVWMSGYGLAEDGSGNVYFTTGNSDRLHDTYDGVTNIQESVVKLDSSLSMTSLFTPADVFTLDQGDQDYASGGVMLLPTQSGPIPHLAVAGGKIGKMFLLNQTNLGGHTTTDAGAVGVVSINSCWCGPSYFSNGVPSIVTSGGVVTKSGTTKTTTVNLRLWTLQTSPSVKLVSNGTVAIPSGQDPGLMTSVSSNGSSNAIVWAVTRPSFATLSNGTKDTRVSLYAINPKPSSGTLPVLFHQEAGTWIHSGGNANIVPVVANGHVYVASYKRLSIFGPLPAGAVSQTVTVDSPEIISLPDPTQHEIFGTISSVSGSQFTLQTRTGSLQTVDASLAIQNDLCIGLQVGGAVDVHGTINSSGVLVAVTVQRAKDSPDLWPNDI